MERQIEGTSNGSTYQIIDPKLANMWQAMKRKEESMKIEKLRQQIHGNMEVAHMPKIDDRPIPRSKIMVVEFNVENEMKTLWITVDSEGNSKFRMIKPSTNAEIGQWCLNQKAVQDKANTQFWGLTRTHKKRLQRSKAMNKMKQSLAVIANLKARRQGENSLS